MRGGLVNIPTQVKPDHGEQQLWHLSEYPNMLVLFEGQVDLDLEMAGEGDACSRVQVHIRLVLGHVW